MECNQLAADRCSTLLFDDTGVAPKSTEMRFAAPRSEGGGQA